MAVNKVNHFHFQRFIIKCLVKHYYTYHHGCRKRRLDKKYHKLQTSRFSSHLHRRQEPSNSPYYCKDEIWTFLKKKNSDLCLFCFFLQLNPYQLIIRFFNIFRTYGCNVYILLKFFIYNTFFKNIYKNIKHL